MFSQPIGLPVGGFVVTVDLPGPRIVRLKENAGRMKHLPVRILASDIRKLTEERLETDGLPTRFDAVLVDVPCSNTGVLGKRPEARWRIQPKDLQELPELQERLLLAVSQRLKPGGRIVYSTCSIEPEENRQVVESVLAQSPQLQLSQEFEYRPGQPADGGYQALLTSRE